jgi:UDP-N-acetylmuramoyl-L-alanyl-D-glutamate--2,6-diaminopimelate ligase
MRFDELLASARIEGDTRLPDGLTIPDVTGLSYRDSSVTPGALFFCVPGERFDGHTFAAAAVERGAVALVCSRPIEVSAPQVIVADVRRAMAPIAAAFYGRPSESLRLVGVTGTNGKTTTTHLVRHLLEAQGTGTGLLGTVESVIGGERRGVERTTPEAIDLQRSLREMLDAGDGACAMEVSSHALQLHRTDAIAWDAAVFTNMTQDHLDFHGTLDRYFDAKRSLFVREDRTLPRVSVVNVDDDWGRRLAAQLSEIGPTQLVSFGIGNEADYRATSVDRDAAGSHFQLHHPHGDLEVRLSLPGLFNVYNALAATAAAVNLGYDIDNAVPALAHAPPVAGRLEPIEEGQPFGVLVDYAHTPDSLDAVLRASRDLIERAEGRGAGELICVFGAGGDRDAAKRPLMGRIAARLSDTVIVTSDNPRSEDPDAIIDQIISGIDRADRTDVVVEPDRKAAIALALERAHEGDLVLVAGKGHEPGQEFEDGRTIPFDDREVARELLRGAGRQVRAS